MSKPKMVVYKRTDHSLDDLKAELDFARRLFEMAMARGAHFDHRGGGSSWATDFPSELAAALWRHLLRVRRYYGFKCACAGMNNREIARDIAMSEATVRTDLFHEVRRLAQDVRQGENERDILLAAGLIEAGRVKIEWKNPAFEDAAVRLSSFAAQ